MQYNESWYEKIDQLVFDYQDGDLTAASKLIEAFDGYIEKFVRLLYEGKVNLDDRDSRRFLSLFIPDNETRKALRRKRQSGKVRDIAHRTASFLQRSCSSSTREDIKQELICVLLKLANRYKKKKKRSNFAGYIYTSFAFELNRSIRPLVRDPLTFAGNLHIPYLDTEYVDEDGNPIDENDPYEHKLVSPLDEDLGTNWIHGLTSNPLFSRLSALDRLILKMYYVDEFNDREISDRTGFHINTINSRRRAAKAFIEREYRDGRD